MDILAFDFISLVKFIIVSITSRIFIYAGEF